MKFLTIILSFYLIILAAVPCIDRYFEVNPAHKIELIQEKHNNNHSDSDSCSPFCTCNCCATAVVFQTQTVQFTCYPFSEKQYFPITSEFISDPLATIWQPPKIA